MRVLLLGAVCVGTIVCVTCAVGEIIYEQDFDSLSPMNLAGQDGWTTVAGREDIVVQADGNTWGTGWEWVQSAGINNSGNTGKYSAAQRPFGATYSSSVMTVIVDLVSGKEVSYWLGDAAAGSWILLEHGALGVTDIMLLTPDGYTRFGIGINKVRCKLEIDLDSGTVDGWYEGNSANVRAGIYTGTFNQQTLPEGFSISDMKMRQRHGWVGSALDNISVDMATSGSGTVIMVQ